MWGGGGYHSFQRVIGHGAVEDVCFQRDNGRQVRAAIKGDRDPGYGSTSKMISECAICLLRDTPDVPAGFWTPGAAMQGKLIKRLVENAGLTFEIEK